MRVISRSELNKLKPVPIKPDDTVRLAEQAIASMRDAINHNEVIMSEVARLLLKRPVKFNILRDGKGDMVTIVPIYE